MQKVIIVESQMILMMIIGGHIKYDETYKLGKINKLKQLWWNIYQQSSNLTRNANKNITACLTFAGGKNIT